MTKSALPHRVPQAVRIGVLGPVRLAAAGLFLAAVLGCQDPVRDEAQAALGPEADGVRKGPLHRPGQPCLVCHEVGAVGGPSGLAMAGTVYTDADTKVPINEATVVLQDAFGHTQTTATNCAGNFMLRPEEFTLQYPVWVTVQAAGQTIDMESPIYREGSCAACHSDPPSPTSAGHVFLLANPQPLPARFHCP